MTGKIQAGARMILGLIYFVFGAMGLSIALGLMKMPNEPMPQNASTFMTGIMAAVYFFPLLKLTEFFCGFLLLINRAAPLALVILAPITLHILCFHAFLTPGIGNSILPLFMILAQTIAMLGYWNLYQPLFREK